jgi:hypothetical protein
LGAAGLGSLGVIIGGIAGAIAGIDESLGTGSLPPAALDELLGKLKKYSRGAGEVPPTVSVVPAPVSTEGARLAEKETQPALAANQGQEPGQPVPADKYCRLHLSLGLGYFRSSGTSQLKNLIKDIGFTASESITFGNTVIIEYPDVMHNPTLLFNDIKVEYSLSRKFALGLVYAPLGEHTVSGRQVIPGKDYRDSYLPETYFIGSYRGRMFFLTASYFPIPDAFLKKTSVKVTAGIGFGKLAVNYYGAEYSSSYQDPSPYNPVDKKNFAKSGAGAFLCAELIYFFNRHWSLGINADYKYAPLRSSGVTLDCPYWYYANSGGPKQFGVLTVQIPSRTYDLGGPGIGLHFGFHF